MNTLCHVPSERFAPHISVTANYYQSLSLLSVRKLIQCGLAQYE
jgi:hypothetical protein